MTDTELLFTLGGAAARNPADRRLDEELADVLEGQWRTKGKNRHCQYCGAPCYGASCRAHAHLARLERAARGDGT